MLIFELMLFELMLFELVESGDSGFAVIRAAFDGMDGIAVMESADS